MAAKVDHGWKMALTGLGLLAIAAASLVGTIRAPLLTGQILGACLTVFCTAVGGLFIGWADEPPSSRSSEGE